MLSHPLPQSQRLDLISFLAQDPLSASISQVASEIQFLRECPQTTTNKRKAKMVRPAIESDNSGESAATSSFGVALTTTSNRNGRVNRWGTRVNNANGQCPGWGKSFFAMLSLYLLMLIVAIVSVFLCTRELISYSSNFIFEHSCYFQHILHPFSSSITLLAQNILKPLEQCRLLSIYPATWNFQYLFPFTNNVVTLTKFRIEQLLVPLSQPLPMSSTHLKILDGMHPHIF